MFIPIDLFSTRITAGISAVVTSIPIPATAAAFLGTLIAPTVSGGYTYLVLRDGTVAETVKVTSRSGNLLVVERAAGQFPAAAFPNGASLTFQWVQQAIEDWTTQNVSTVPITITGSGAVSVTGTYPNFNVGASPPAPVTNNNSYITNPPVEGAGIAVVTHPIGFPTLVSVAEPVFTSDANIVVSGTYPNYNFAFTGPTGGVVQNVVTTLGTVVIGGTPEVPTVDLAEPGISAATYGGLNVDVFGRVVSVDAAFNPVFDVSSDNGAIVVTTVARMVSIAAQNATLTDIGVVQLSNAAAIFVGTDETTAATPKAVADVIATIKPRVAGVVAHTAAPDAAYTAVVGSLLTCTPGVGQNALVTAHVALSDSAGSTLPYVGIAVFDQATNTLLFGIEEIYSFVHTLSFVINGPLTYQLELRLTTLPGTVSVKSAALTYALGGA